MIRSTAAFLAALVTVLPGPVTAADDALVAALTSTCPCPGFEEGGEVQSRAAHQRCVRAAARILRRDPAIAAADVEEAARAARGACGLGPCGPDGLTCGRSHACLWRPESCGEIDVALIGCAPRRRRVCDDAIRPVCGCDGRTYLSGCALQRAGVSILHAGPCAD